MARVSTQNQFYHGELRDWNKKLMTITKVSRCSNPCLPAQWPSPPIMLVQVLYSLTADAWHASHAALDDLGSVNKNLRQAVCQRLQNQCMRCYNLTYYYGQTLSAPVAALCLQRIPVNNATR